jgi:hypothetical protein
MAYWVDFVNGNDETGDGSQERPFRTPERADKEVHLRHEGEEHRCMVLILGDRK